MRSLILILLLASPAVGEDLTEGKVYEALDNYKAAMADLEEQRYAVVGRGLARTRQRGTMKRYQWVIWVAMKNGDDIYQSRSAERIKGADQVWRERIVDDGEVRYRVKTRNGVQLDSVVLNMAKEKQIKKEALFTPVYPMESAMAFTHGTNDGPSLYSRGMITVDAMMKELVTAKFNETGDIESKWVSTLGPTPSRLEVSVTFGKEYDFMPTYSNARFVTESNGKIIKRVPLGETNTEWEKIRERWLPAEISFGPSGKERKYYKVDFRWKVGDDIPKSVDLVDSKLDDWNKPARDLFDETWQIKGMSPNLTRSRRD